MESHLIFRAMAVYAENVFVFGRGGGVISMPTFPYALNGR